MKALTIALGEPAHGVELCPKCRLVTALTYPVILLDENGTTNIGETLVCWPCWAEENPKEAFGV